MCNLHRRLDCIYKKKGRPEGRPDFKQLGFF